MFKSLFKIKNLKFKIKKRLVAAVLVLIVVGVPLVYLLLLNSKETKAAWFDDNLLYRRSIAVTNNTSAETNVYIEVSLDTETLINNSQLQADCGDLRYTTYSGDILQYYISDCDNAASTIHIKFDSFPAGAQTIYYYYGNTSAGNGFEGVDFSIEASNYTIGSTGSEEISPAPVGYWKFDEGFGTVTQNLGVGGTAANATFSSGSGAPTWQTEDQCITGKCLLFDGNDSAFVSDNPALKPTHVTVSAWVKITSTPDANHGGGIVSKNLTGSNEGSYEIIVDSNFRAQFRAGDLSDESILTPNNTLIQNQWHFITGVYDGTNIYIYIDGNLIDSDAATGNLSYDTGTLRIGVRGNGLGSFPGFIDEVKIYPYARTAAQIKTDYNSRGTVKGASVNLGSNPQNNSAALSNGLVGYWKMDESSGNAADSSGNGLTATNTNTATFLGGKFGNAAHFTAASSQYFARTSSSTLQVSSGSFTLTGWVYLDSKSADRYIIWKGDSTGANTEYGIRYVQNVGMRLSFVDGTTASSVTASNFGDLSTGTWYFVAAWYNSVEKAAYISVNGGTPNVTPVTGSLLASTHQLEIGARVDVNQYMDGRLDEMRIYNRALSPADVSALYNFAPGPVGYWNMDENQGTSANDRSGNGNTGTISGATWKPGKYGSSLSFNGTSDGINLGDISQLEFKSADAFTVSTWVKANTISANSHIIGKMGGSAAFQGWVFWIGSTGVPTVILRNDNATNNQIAANATNAIDNNTWRHVAFSYNGSSAGSGIKFYIDGVLQTTTTTIDNLSGEMQNTSVNASIGYRDSTSSVYFPGQIDEVKVYKYIRNNKQIIEDMNAGHPAVGSPVGSAIGHWKFDEGFSTATNNSGNQGSALNGTMSGFASPATSTSGWTNSGKFGKALIFDGSNDYVLLPKVVDTTPFTVTLWFKQTGSPVGNDDIFFSQDTSGDSGRLILGPYTAGKLRFFIGGDAVTGNTVLSEDTWYYAAFVRDESGNGKIYLNGKEDGSGTLNTNTITATNAVVGSLLRDLTLGFPGYIDEVKIYNNALTTDQVKLDMNRGSATVLGALSDNTSYEKSAANQEYCVPGDSTSCAAPIAQWNFDEKQGQTAYDTSGNDLHLTLGANDSVSTDDPSWTRGKIGSALSYDGADYATIADNSLLEGMSTITISAWFKLPNTTSDYTMILDKWVDGGSATNSSYYVAVHADGSIQWQIRTTGTTSGTNSGSGYDDNKWHFLEITYDGINSRLYVDGILLSTTPTTGTVGTTASALNIGKGGDHAVFQYFNGQIDQIRFFNYARSTAQVAWDYNRGAPIGHWKFDECQGTTAYDSSTNSNGQSNGNIGTITIGGSGTQTSAGTCIGSANTAWKDGAVGKYNSSLDFDGTDDYVNTTYTKSSGDGTVSVWFKGGTQTSDALSVIRPIIAQGQFDAAGFTYPEGILIQMYRNGFANHGKLSFQWGEESAAGSITTTNTYNDNNWHHAVLTKSGTTATAYVDGVLIGSFTAVDAVNTSTAFQIGGSSTVTVRKFTGQIDDVQIYNYALTSTQIKNLQNQGAAVRFGPITDIP